jgi:glycosyltransferase involved in cell wall biosynthesis
MRVAFDVTPVLGGRTGVPQAVAHLLEALPAAAPEVDLQPYVLSGRARLDPGSRSGAPAGTRVLPLPAGLAVRAWGRLGRPRGDRWLGDADVVHGSNFVAPPMRCRPVSVTVWDCWCARHPASCPSAVAASARAVRRLVDRGAWLHVTSEHVAREVREVYGAERVVVVPLAVPTVAPATGPPPAGAPFVLALGALDRRKNLDALVRAFGAVAGAEGVPDDLGLVLAGPDGPARGAVDLAVAGLDPAVARRVRVLGTVDDQHRAILLRSASVLAYPSLDEGFGFPVLEAMAVGTPVVATRAGAVPEVAGEAAELVPVGDDEALATALVRVLADAPRRRELAAAGRARAATYSWAATAAGLADLWRRAAA